MDTLNNNLKATPKIGWIRQKGRTQYRPLKPTPLPPIVKCKELWQLPTCGRVQWRSINRLKGIKGYTQKRWLQLGRDGHVPQAQFNAEFNRYEWDAQALREHIKKKFTYV